MDLGITKTAPVPPVTTTTASSSFFGGFSTQNNAAETQRICRATWEGGRSFQKNKIVSYVIWFVIVSLLRQVLVVGEGL